MKIQGSRFAAITSALALMVTGLVGVQPASASSATPASLAISACVNSNEATFSAPRIIIGGLGTTFGFTNNCSDEAVFGNSAGAIKVPNGTTAIPNLAAGGTQNLEVSSEGYFQVTISTFTYHFFVSINSNFSLGTIDGGKHLNLSNLPNYNPTPLQACTNPIPTNVAVVGSGSPAGNTCVALSTSQQTPFDLSTAQIGGTNYVSSQYPHITRTFHAADITGTTTAYLFSATVQANVVAATPLTATAASVSADGRVVTISMSQGIFGPSLQVFTVIVDGNARSSSVGSIMPGATSVILNLSAQNAISSGAVVTVSYSGPLQGAPRIVADLAPSVQLADFSGLSVTNNSTVGGSPSSEAVTTPYNGPILQTPGAAAPVAQGSKVVIPGSNLSGVSKVEIGGLDAKVVVNSAGELEITVPTGLASGTYDLVVTSDSGKLTVQDAIRVSGSAVVSETSESTARPSTKLKEDNTVKVHVFDVVGAGKVQIMFNGKEIAWVNTTDPNDPKLFDEYLVRTLELVDGKNVIEIFVDGKRVDRKAYTK